LTGSLVLWASFPSTSPASCNGALEEEGPRGTAPKRSWTPWSYDCGDISSGASIAATPIGTTLFSQWWLSDANEDYRYTVTGMQVDSVLKATKRRNDKALAAFVSSRKKRRLNIKGNWVEDLANSKLSRLNTTYRRGVNLRVIKRRPVYSDETLALESRDEFIRKLMSRQKRRGHHP
jgi:hypothetical protein